MKKIYFHLLLAFILMIPVFAQTVSTLVPGPSTFNDGLEIDAEGNIYASRYNGTTVTKITPSGTTSIFADGFSNPNGLKFGPDGFLYVPSAAANKIQKVSQDGTVSDFITINTPSDLYFDSDGLLYVTDYQKDIISVVDSSKNITTLFSGGLLNGPIGILKDSAGTIYIGNFTDGKVFRVDSGNTFVQIGDLPGWLGFMVLVGENIYATAYKNNRIYKIPINGSGQSVFAGTGIAGGTDGDVTTAKFSTPNGIVASLTGDTLYISEYTPRRLRMITGVLTTTPVKKEETGMIDHFLLKQNYPNPFNPSTKISWQSPVGSWQTLKVFDVLGKEVATLVDEEKPAGSSAVEFNASNLTSGIYFYTLQIGAYTETRKMILLR